MKEINHSERAHSKLGASSASRWMACPASVELSEQAPDEGHSAYASEGTCAHELAEVALLGSGNCSDYIGETYEGFTVTQEMADYTQIYVDYVIDAGSGEYVDTLIEERFSLDHIRDDMFGTNDACVLEPFGTLEIIDLKYGKGVEVEAKDNKQLLYYALGAAKGNDFEKVKLTIIQPRVENPIKSWTIPFKELKVFEETLKQAVEAVESPNPKFETGSHCRWCKAKAICPKKLEEAQAVARMDFSNEISPSDSKSLPEPSTLNVVQIKNILDHSKDIEDWLKSVAKYAQVKMEAGGHIDGYKLVRGRATRKYVSEADVIANFEAVYGDSIYAKRKLLGIPAMEKLVGKEDLSEYVYKPEGSITVAKRDDKRAEYIPAPMFPEIVEEEEAVNKEQLIQDCLDDFDNYEF